MSVAGRGLGWNLGVFFCAQNIFALAGLRVEDLSRSQKSLCGVRAGGGGGDAMLPPTAAKTHINFCLNSTVDFKAFY